MVLFEAAKVIVGNAFTVMVTVEGAETQFAPSVPVILYTLFPVLTGVTDVLAVKVVLGLANVYVTAPLGVKVAVCPMHIAVLLNAMFSVGVLGFVIAKVFDTVQPKLSCTNVVYVPADKFVIVLVEATPFKLYV